MLGIKFCGLVLGEQDNDIIMIQKILMIFIFKLLQATVLTINKVA